MTQGDWNTDYFTEYGQYRAIKSHAPKERDISAPSGYYAPEGWHAWGGKIFYSGFLKNTLTTKTEPAKSPDSFQR